MSSETLAPVADTLADDQIRTSKKRSGFTASELALMVKLSREGKTQTEIAQRFGKTQSYIGKLLRQFEDTSPLAKDFLKGSALHMAQNIVKKGLARDHVQTLKGIGVLEEQQAQGLSIVIGSNSSVKIGLLSPVPRSDLACANQE